MKSVGSTKGTNGFVAEPVTKCSYTLSSLSPGDPGDPSDPVAPHDPRDPEHTACGRVVFVLHSHSCALCFYGRKVLVCGRKYTQCIRYSNLGGMRCISRAIGCRRVNDHPDILFYCCCIVLPNPSSYGTRIAICPGQRMSPDSIA